MTYCCRGKHIDLSTRSLIMGILNVTPDSFSDGGCFYESTTAIDHAMTMINQGADIIDVGGESSRPGAQPLTVTEELDRVIPVIQGIKDKSSNALISIDTTKAAVARDAVNAGADIINDISGLQADEGIAQVAAETGAGLILMHMRGTPETMMSNEHLAYDNLIAEVRLFFEESIEKAVGYGVDRQGIMLDPGIGFAKNCRQNLVLLNRISEFKKLGVPVLVGHSRKSFIGQVLEEPDAGERVWGTAGVTAWLAMNDVEVIRVHDVKPMKQLLQMLGVCRDPELFKDSC